MEIIDHYIKNSGMNLEDLAIDGFISYKIQIGDLLHFLSFLKLSEDLRFTILTDIFVADFPDRAKRFEIVYSLLSLKLNLRILLKIDLADAVKVPTSSSIFSASCWYEREIYDMFGVEFDGLADHRRILTDYDFVGYPLRKDFPLSGYMQVRYDEDLKKVIYEPVSLSEEFREFDFASPWHGPNYILPGDEKANKKYS